MTIQEVKAKLENERMHGAKAKGMAVSWSETGPVGVGMISAIVELLEQQQTEIDALKKKLGGITLGDEPRGDN